MAMSMSATYTGRVVSVNPKGLKLDGHDDWYNVSKFATDVILPERGETVTVVVDGKGFLRAVQPYHGAVPAPSAATATLAPCAPSGWAATSKDRTITRLACLKAAAEFSASKQASSSADVLLVAAAWERWVLREDTAEEDNVDAF